MVRERQHREIPIRVQGKHIAVTDALRGHVQAKFAKLPRHFDQIQDAQVVLSVARDRTLGRAQIAEITLWGDGLVLRAEELSEDMYLSVDRAIQKLDRQIRKYRARFIQKRRIEESRQRRRAQRTAEAALKAGPPPSAEPAGEPSSEESPSEGLSSAGSAFPRVVRTKRFAMKPMTLAEAALQMDLLGHAFFVFRNSTTQDVNVLYKRRDGDYGLIEPEG